MRNADAADLERIVALAEDCPGAPGWTLATWRQVMDSAVTTATGSPGSVERGAQQRCILLAEAGRELVGFGVVGVAGEVAEFESVVVSPGARRQGIGRRLCEAMMHWAGLHGASKAVLEARLSNDTARALYESLGFHSVAVRRGYYREPDEDGLVMTREL